MSRTEPPRWIGWAAAYAIGCVCWAVFSHSFAPRIIAMSHDAGGPIIGWLIEGPLLPVEYYQLRWRVVADAALLAAIAHLGIVLLVGYLYPRHQVASESGSARISLPTILVMFAAAFLAAAVLSEARGDYTAYLREWEAVLSGADPWAYAGYPLNAYGPLFNLLAFPVVINPLANKLLFASAYIVFIVWLLGGRESARAFSEPTLAVWAFWLANPYPWIEIAWFGHMDALVALACVAAVHYQAKAKDGVSGAILASGVLLKFLPIVIVPALVFSEKRVRVRLLVTCIAVVGAGMIASISVWGASTLLPLEFAVKREPSASIHELVVATWPFDHWQAPIRPAWLERLVLFAALALAFAVGVVYGASGVLFSMLTVMVSLTFYRVGYINYQLVLFFLVSYWAMKECARSTKNGHLHSMLVVYFAFLAVLDLAIVAGLEQYGQYSLFAVLVKSLLGIMVLAAMIEHVVRNRVIGGGSGSIEVAGGSR